MQRANHPPQRLAQVTDEAGRKRALPNRIVRIRRDQDGWNGLSEGRQALKQLELGQRSSAPRPTRSSPWFRPRWWRPCATRAYRLDYRAPDNGRGPRRILLECAGPTGRAWGIGTAAILMIRHRPDRQAMPRGRPAWSGMGHEHTFTAWS